MQTKIISRKLSATLTFSRPDGANVYVDLNGRAGTLGLQLCKGGKLSGSTVQYEGDDPESFAALCRKWYASHIRSTARCA